MLKSCRYCGKIHDSKYECGKRPVRRKKKDDVDRFRSTTKWTKIAKDIKERDCYLCQACLHDLDGQGVRYTSEGLETHHIDSVDNAWDSRMDYENLITLCRYHHEMAEMGHISKAKLKEIAKKNNEYPK